MFRRATILTDRQTDRQTDIQTDRQTDRRYKSVFLPYFFIYSVIQYETAGGGDFQKGCDAVSWIPVPGGLFAFRL